MMQYAATVLSLKLTGTTPPGIMILSEQLHRTTITDSTLAWITVSVLNTLLWYDVNKTPSSSKTNFTTIIFIEYSCIYEKFQNNMVAALVMPLYVHIYMDTCMKYGQIDEVYEKYKRYWPGRQPLQIVSWGISHSRKSDQTLIFDGTNLPETRWTQPAEKKIETLGFFNSYASTQVSVPNKQ